MVVEDRIDMQGEPVTDASERQVSIVPFVHRILREASDAATEAALHSSCLAAAAEASGAAFAFIGEFTVGGARLANLAFHAAGLPADAAMASSGAVRIAEAPRRALRDGRAVLVNGPDAETLLAERPSAWPSLDAFLAAPLRRGDRTLGVIGLGNRPGGFRAGDLAAIEALAPVIMHAVDSWRAESGRLEAERRVSMLQERERLAVAAQLHRVRNVLTIIRSIFNRTVENGGDLESVAHHFRGRVDSLARLQGALTTSDDGRADLESLVRDEILSVGAGGWPNVRIGGPDVRLPAKAAELVGLAIHELTTNALKYGALTTPDGILTIGWETNASYSGPTRLDIVWTESNVPVVVINPAHSGFGRELIEEALPYRLGAETSLVIRGGGVSCRMSIPFEGANPTELGIGADS